MTGSFPWLSMLAVAVGSVFGVGIRWAAQSWLNRGGQPFPYGTLLVNLVGGLLIGGCLAWLARTPNEIVRLLLVTGFLGGMTTFSSFSGESLLLLQRGEWLHALGHTAAHVLGALACAAIGFRAVDSLIRQAALQ